MRMSLMLCLLGLALFAGLPALSAGKYRDIYLTGDRVCRKCIWRKVEAVQGHPERGYLVELSNKAGRRAVVKPEEIVGVNTHPVARKLFMKGLHGTGLAGKVIVPYAFEDGQDMVCKYCDDSEL